MHPINPMDKEKAGTAVTLLLQAGAILRHSQFQRWINSNDSRFPWADERVLAKLRRSFFDGMTSSLPASLARSAQTPESIIGVAADVLNEAAGCLAGAAGISIAAKDRRFALPRTSSPGATFTGILSRSDIGDVVRDVCAAGRLSPAVQSAASILNDVHKLVGSLDTLRFGTNNKPFEQLLGSVDTQWLLSGYPHDLLFCDADAIRRLGSEVTRIAVNRHYCSTWIETRTEPFPDSVITDDFRVIRLSGGSRKNALLSNDAGASFINDGKAGQEVLDDLDGNAEQTDLFDVASDDDELIQRPVAGMRMG